MIPYKVFEEYEQRARDDFRSCLDWQNADIERAVAKLPSRPPIFEELRRAQRICVVLGAHLNRFGFYNDMGTGKSFIAMALAAYFKATTAAESFLILVPNRVNIDGWLAQVRKHAPQLKAVALPSKMADKLATLEFDDALLFIETYAGFARLCSHLVLKPTAKKRELVVDPAMLKRVTGLLDGIIADESSALGHHNTLQTEVITKIGKLDPDMPIFLLSGTPFGRDPELLWSQFRILDGGYTLGGTLGLFRGSFFNTKENYWGAFEHKFRIKETNRLHRYIAHRSIRFQLDEADLPKLVPVRVELELAADAKQYYAAALEQLKSSGGSFELQKNAFIRMRQIASGFINVVDPETGIRERLEMTENPKLEWVKSQIDTIDPAHKVIVFHDFTFTGELLMRELKKLGVACALINGRIGKREVAKAYTGFTEGKVQWLILNSQAGAYGLNLQMARYGIYYESPVPVIIRKQTELRYIRPESSHGSVVRTDLVVKGTVDADILKFHETGKNLFESILDGTYKL